MGKSKSSKRSQRSNVSSASQCTHEIVQCPHLHFKSDVIDRNVLSKEQHLNLLSTPKGYRWEEASDKKEGGQGEGTENLPTKLPRRVVCTGRRMKKPEKVYVHNFLAEVWTFLTPEMIDRLKGMLMNEFGMSPQEADQLVNEQRESNIVKSSTVSLYKKPRKLKDGSVVYDSIVKLRSPNKSYCDKYPKSSIGIRNAWIRDFSDMLSEKISSYVLDTMCAERTERQQEIAQTLLTRFNSILEQKASMSNPKTKTHKAMVLVADKLSLWLDKNVKMSKETAQRLRELEEEEEKKRLNDEKKRRDEENMRLEAEKKRKEEENMRLEEEKKRKEDEEEKKRKEDEEKRLADEKQRAEEEAQKGAALGEPEQPPPKGGEPTEEQPKPEDEETKQPEAQSEEAEKPTEDKEPTEETQPEPAEQQPESEEPKPETEEAPKAEEEEQKAEPEPTEEEKAPEDQPPTEPEEEKPPEPSDQPQSETDEEKSPEEGAQKEETQREGEPEEALKTEEPEPQPEPIEPSEFEGEESDKPTEESEPPTTDEESEKPSETVESEEAEGEREPSLPGSPKPEETPTETPAETPAESGLESEDEKIPESEEETKPEEGVGGEAAMAPVEEEKAPKEERVPSALKEMIKSVASIIAEQEASPTPRQEAIKDVMGKELEKKLGDEDKEVISEVSSKIGTWMDKIVDKVEEEYGDKSEPSPPVAQRPKGRIFKLRKLDNAFDVELITNTNAEQRVREARGKPFSSYKTVDTSVPLEPADLKDWAKWASEVTDMAQNWAEWIEDTVQEAQKKSDSYKNIEAGEKMKDWAEFKDKKSSDAVEWRRTKKQVDQQAQAWSKKTEKEKLTNQSANVNQ